MGQDSSDGQNSCDQSQSLKRKRSSLFRLRRTIRNTAVRACRWNTSAGVRAAYADPQHIRLLSKAIQQLYPADRTDEYQQHVDRYVVAVARERGKIRWPARVILLVFFMLLLASAYNGLEVYRLFKKNGQFPGDLVLLALEFSIVIAAGFTLSVYELLERGYAVTAFYLVALALPYSFVLSGSAEKLEAAPPGPMLLVTSVGLLFGFLGATCAALYRYTEPKWLPRRVARRHPEEFVALCLLELLRRSARSPREWGGTQSGIWGSARILERVAVTIENTIPNRGSVWDAQQRAWMVRTGHELASGMRELKRMFLVPNREAQKELQKILRRAINDALQARWGALPRAEIPLARFRYGNVLAALGFVAALLLVATVAVWYSVEKPTFSSLSLPSWVAVASVLNPALILGFTLWRIFFRESTLVDQTMFQIAQALPKASK